MPEEDVVAVPAELAERWLQLARRALFTTSDDPGIVKDREELRRTVGELIDADRRAGVPVERTAQAVRELLLAAGLEWPVHLVDSELERKLPAP
jgi:hypothetical protein